MLGKLLKYELKSTSRLFGVIYLVILVLSLVIGISGRSFFQEILVVNSYGDNYVAAKGISFVIMLIVYFIFVFALAVITFVVILERFYKNLLRGEGYLMHTLPVPTWMLVASKTISAFIWNILGGAVVILSLIIIASSGGVWKTLMAGLANVLSSEFVVEWDIMCSIWIVAFLVGSIRLILTFYVSMAIGGATKRHKKLLSVLVFICIVVLIQIVTMMLGVGTAENVFLHGYESTAGNFINMYMIKNIILEIVLSAVFFILTTFFLQKKLNLE